jgi:hypothetical protein
MCEVLSPLCPQLGCRGGWCGGKVRVAWPAQRWTGWGLSLLSPPACAKGRAHPSRVPPVLWHKKGVHTSPFLLSPRSPVARDCVGKWPHDRGKGCEHSPELVPCARPLHTPPFTCHLAHTALHVGQCTQGTRKVGCTGVLHEGRCRVVLTCDVGGALLPFSAPLFTCRPWVLHHPVACDGGRAEGWRGAFLHGPVCPHTKGGRGACCTAACVPAPILRAPPITPVHVPLPVHARMGMPPLHTPFVQAGRRQKRWARGLCHMLVFPCPVEVQTRPRLCINGGGIKGSGEGSCACCPVQLSRG